MILVDVNILVHAFRTDTSQHETVRRWLEAELSADRPFAFSGHVASGFLRIVTNPNAFLHPAPLPRALDFVDGIRLLANCVVVEPGRRHWDIFLDLCRKVQAKGNLVPDAYFAALAIESGSEWITMDRDYARFPGLRWRDPMEH